MPDGDNVGAQVVVVKRANQNYRLAGQGGRSVQKLDVGAGYSAVDSTLTTMGTPPNAAGAVISNAFDPEDEYQKLYVGGVNSKGLLEPPYILRMLDRLSQENNALSPCIEAMVDNIDGTGHVFEKTGDKDMSEDETDPMVKMLEGFFAEPWPGESLMMQRKRLRRDIERIGNGYLELIRNPRDDITFTRPVDGKMMRIVKLDNPTVTRKTVIRNGKEVSIKMQVRERRYAQLLNGRALIYFKEFGASRDLNKYTGLWAPQGERLPANQRATEIMHFIAVPDAHTPYGVPRWIGQIPSVVGSRKAEEFNLDFFDNGGVPPLLILLQGGTLTEVTRKALEDMFTQGAKRANRTQVLESEPTGGSIDQNSTSRITVERFGHERQNDSMFEKYDERCELRVRRGFRLPPVFVGGMQDASFATAYASYVVAEAQVFKPLREAFDEAFTLQILPAMGARGYCIRSKPMQINDSSKQLQGIELAGKTDRVPPEDLVREINEVMDLNLKVSPVPVIGFGEATATLTLQPPGVNTSPNAPNTPSNVTTSPSTPSNKKPTPSPSPTTGTPSSSGKAVPKVSVGKKADIEEDEVEANALGVFEDAPVVKGDKPGDNAPTE